VLSNKFYNQRLTNKALINHQTPVCKINYVGARAYSGIFLCNLRNVFGWLVDLVYVSDVNTVTAIWTIGLRFMLVHADERTRVHNARPSLVVTHQSINLVP